ncbi:VTC domain protein [Pseudobythopirellula maris]|uniref:VTC domain protein n=1 Tax=Pseudobythopirellula maris TaxID=2527991 RepID=A0A5C5ZMX0_9BACT|nr:polyphosphate polymerase domain-containing protein [Pseudobythopirellula maris]TWT88822.1 VTC domain protein [Pseudobythopirellula maris]
MPANSDHAASADPGPLDAAARLPDPLSLAEIEGSALMNRVDVKHLVSESQAAGLIRQLADEYRVLEIDGLRAFEYSTLYFDTPRLDCYLDHHNRRPLRRKYRMREYVASGARFLEIKTRDRRGRTDKRREPIAEFELSMSADSRQFVHRVTGAEPELAPQLWVRYRRLTLAHRQRAERVTLDWDLAFEQEGAVRRVPRVVIVEIKQDANDRSSPARAELRRLGLRPLRVSKYCLGTALLKPHLKQNRFKPKLRAIERIA